MKSKGILRTFKGSYSQYHLQLEAERLAEKEARGNNAEVKELPRKPVASAEDKRKRARLEGSGNLDRPAGR